MDEKLTNSEPITVQQLIDRLDELEDIADELKDAVEYYQFHWAFETYAHQSVVKLNNYKREYYHPRPVENKQPGAAW